LAVLEPAEAQRLEDVCAFIAEQATRPRIRPASLFGAPCLTAGVFLTIRSLLHRAGADVHRLTPSTPLAPFARRHLEVFLGPITRLAPGALPPVDIQTPVYDTTVWGSLIGLLFIGIGSWASVPWLTIAGGFIFVVSYLTTWVAVAWFLPSRVDFGDVRTFRDLAQIIASQART